ncbi:MAG: hypothetical protein ACI8PT_000936, partial [Gammaproteobacteria bacterium]
GVCGPPSGKVWLTEYGVWFTGGLKLLVRSLSVRNYPYLRF